MLPSPRRSERSFALIATLALVAVATILLVLFVTVSSQDRSASYSYSQSVKADQIGQGALRLVVSSLQAEMYKDAMPDTNGSATAVPVFTNLASFNIQPQANVSNPDLPTLITTSTNGLPFFTGTNANASLAISQLQGSSISTTAPSLNGRFVSTNVWNQAYFGPYKTTAETPNWVLVTRNGPSSGVGLSLGPGTTTANNPVAGNNNYVLGRMAYAIYDESGLLDVTVAGYPGTGSNFPLTPPQIAQIKGTLAGVDLSQIPGITSPSAFINWRNSGSDASGANFVSSVNTFASTNGFRQVYPGDSTFLSRQDLIAAALNGTAGLSTAALPYLTTFTREFNAPSWAPSLNAPSSSVNTGKYNYMSNAQTLTNSTFFTVNAAKQNPNPYIPIVRYAHSGLVTAYNNDGTTYTYQVNVGDPLVQQRFALDKLAWIGPNGINAAAFSGSANQTVAIQACFGLYWDATGPENKAGDPAWSNIPLWKYFGPASQSTTMETATANFNTGSPIETLQAVANENPPRIPNFFELLQAGVLSGSLSVNYSGGANQFQSVNSALQTVPPYQLMRMAASILSQVQPQAYPINIEYNAHGSSLIASGIANLPYINLLKFVTGQSPDDPDQTNPSSTANHQLATYGLVGLWNPHQQATPPVTRPQVRLYLQGDLTYQSTWGNTNYPPTPTYQKVSPAPLTPPLCYVDSVVPANSYYVQLASGTGFGNGGFLNPMGVTTNDVASSGPVTGSSTNFGWAATPSTGTVTSMVLTGDPEASQHVGAYEGFRLPDFYVNFNRTNSAIPGGAASPNDPSNGNNKMSVGLGGTNNATAAVNPFQMSMRYLDAKGNWVPYNYFVGNNNYGTGGTWIGAYGLFAGQMNVGFTTDPAPPHNVYCTSPYQMPSLQGNLHSLSSNNHGAEVFTSDPRSTRFGMVAFAGDTPAGVTYGVIYDPLIDSVWSGFDHSTVAGGVLAPDPYDIGGIGGSHGALGTLPTPLAGTTVGIFNQWYYPGFLSRNNTSLNSTGYNVAGTGVGSYFSAYQDADGVQRIADSGLFASPSSGTTFIGNVGNPFYDPSDQATTSVKPLPLQRVVDRPLVLNRPFASVGELGYAFRDDPWRSVDFFSVFNGGSTSADSGLLDIFTVTDSQGPYPVVAGRVNLNTQNTAVLQAVLNATLEDPVGGTQTMSSTVASTIASRLAAYTKATPLVNKDQLVTGFNPTLTSAQFGSSDEAYVKAYREAYIRALADVGQTRTWNLMIDLVAQSGKYPPNLTTGGLDQFQVDGERHYWLHVAIDRVTGKIVDRQLELIGP
jgi:hypothetical protein